MMIYYICNVTYNLRGFRPIWGFEVSSAFVVANRANSWTASKIECNENNLAGRQGILKEVFAGRKEAGPETKKESLKYNRLLIIMLLMGGLICA